MDRGADMVAFTSSKGRGTSLLGGASRAVPLMDADPFFASAQLPLSFMMSKKKKTRSCNCACCRNCNFSFRGPQSLLLLLCQIRSFSQIRKVDSLMPSLVLHLPLSGSLLRLPPRMLIRYGIAIPILIAIDVDTAAAITIVTAIIFAFGT